LRLDLEGPQELRRHETVPERRMTVTQLTRP